MDVKGGGLSAARGLTRAQTVGPERGRGIEGSDRAWCGRGSALSALRDAVSRGMARGLRALRQDLQRAERYAAVGLEERWLLFGASLAKGER